MSYGDELLRVMGSGVLWFPCGGGVSQRRIFANYVGCGFDIMMMSSLGN